MNTTRFHVPAFAPATVIALVLSACSTTPVAPGADVQGGAVPAVASFGDHSAGMKLYTRPPHRLFGLMQEQGALDVVPDVAPMVEYQQQRMRSQSLLKASTAAPVWVPAGPDTNLGRIIDIAYHPTNPA